MNDDLWETVKHIEGWLTRLEAEQLYRLCNGTWCEIGSWKGRSTVVLAAKHAGYAIDWFKGNIETRGVHTYKEFKHNIEGLKVTVIPERMEQAAGKIIEPLQLLFLDGEHTYTATEQAFKLYEPLVEKGGYIILHDVWGYEGGAPTFPGVTQFAEELLTDSRFKHIDNADRSMALQKL
jgi:predicted O-methyltransferase YrrM